MRGQSGRFRASPFCRPRSPLTTDKDAHHCSPPSCTFPLCPSAPRRLRVVSNDSAPKAEGASREKPEQTGASQVRPAQGYVKTPVRFSFARSLYVPLRMGTGGTAGSSKVSVFWPAAVLLARSRVLRVLLCAIGSFVSLCRRCIHSTAIFPRGRVMGHYEWLR